jgi:hypothetical protein
MFSDTVTCTFIAADCGRQPKTSPVNEREDMKYKFPNLVHCEWSITGEKSDAYNCIAWSVGETGKNYVDVESVGYPNDIAIDTKWGNGDGVMSGAELDAFYDAKGYAPTSRIFEADVVYYAYFHAARRKGCSCSGGKWVMFESKLGKGIRIEHDMDQLKDSVYGFPARFYKHK